MSATINPDIVTDGLVLCYDAANSDCFRGEPTTNKINGLYSTTFANSGFTITNNYGTNFDGSNTASLLLSGSWIARTAGYSSGFVSGNTYTTTWILKNVDMNTLSLAWGGVHTGTRVNVSINLTNGTVSSASDSSLYGIYSLGDGWYAIWYVTTLSGTAHYPTLAASTTGKYILYGGMQVEEKNYPTPIVNGTRGGTVATGGGLFDLSNNNNHGTIVRNAVPTASFYNSGNRGSLVFDGVNDYVSIGTSQFAFGSSPGTLSAWARTSTTSSVFRWIVSYGTATGNQSRFLGFNSTTYYFGGYANDITASGVPLNTWFNMVGVYDGTNASMYINGTLVSGPTAKSWNTVANNAQIGRQTNGSEYWNGDIAQVSVYNKVLTSKQILDNYRATKGRYGL